MRPAMSLCRRRQCRPPDKTPDITDDGAPDNADHAADRAAEHVAEHVAVNADDAPQKYRAWQGSGAVPRQSRPHRHAKSQGQGPQITGTLMKPRKTLLIIASCLGGALLLLGLLAGFVPQREGYEVRRRASPLVISLRPEDMPAPIVSRGDGSRLWALRRAVSPAVATSGRATWRGSAPGPSRPGPARCRSEA